MKLSSLLEPDRIFFDVKGNNREEVYADLVEKLLECKTFTEKSCDELVSEIIEREDITSIPYEKHFAFPHLRLDVLNDLHIAIGILEKPLKLKAEDITETKMIIMFFISTTTSQIYLMALSAFTKFLIKNNNTEKLVNSGSPEEFIAVLNDEKIEVKHTITAEDIMLKEYSYVYENDRITKVLDIFAVERKLILPVIDKNHLLVGQIDSFDLVKKSIPKYMLLLENHQFLTSFEPFENIIKDETSTFVKDYISEPEMIIDPETPLVQLTLLLVKKTLKNLFVVKDGKLLGIVTMQEIINNVLRG